MEATKQKEMNFLCTLPIFTKALRTNTKTTYHQPLHFVCGAAGIIILILNDIGILKLVVKGSSNFILINIVLGLLFIGFIAIGFWSLKYSKNIKSKAAIESRDTDTILAWLKDNVSKDDIEASYLDDIPEEMKYFNRSDYIKKAISKNFPDTNDDLLDTIADKYIDNLFNE